MGGGAAAPAGGEASFSFDGLTLTDELGLESAQAHPTTAGTPALLVSRVVLAVLLPAANGKVTILPSYVVDYALEAPSAQLLDSN